MIIFDILLYQILEKNSIYSTIVMNNDYDVFFILRIAKIFIKYCDWYYFLPFLNRGSNGKYGSITSIWCDSPKLYLFKINFFIK